MKILIIAPRLPFPLFSGGEHAQFYFIDALQNEAEVSLCFQMSSGDYNSTQDNLLYLKERWRNVTFLPYEEKLHERRALILYRTIKRRMFEALFGHNNSSSDHIRQYSLINNPYLTCNAGFVEHVANVVRQSRYDIIQVEFIYLAPLVYVLPEGPFKILVHHELRFLRIQREVELFQNRTASDYSRLQAIKEQEISLLKHFDTIITLSQVDKDFLSESIPADRIYVSPPTIKVQKSSRSEDRPFEDKLVFVGSSMHLPNVDGVSWFVESILPLVEKRIPRIHLDVVGAWSKVFVKKFSRRNVEFTGFVDDLQQVMNGAMLIVPIRIGSGVRLKILEAIQRGRPFISTAIGSEGLNLESGVDCLLADSEQDFANGIVRLARDLQLQRRLVGHASEKMARDFDFASAISRRLGVYERNAEAART